MMASKMLRDAMVANDDFDGWTITISKQVATADKSITIYDLSGRGRVQVFGDGSDDKLLPRVMFKIRGAKGGYAEAYAVAEVISDYIRSLTVGIVAGDTKLCYYSGIGNIDHIGYDDSDRPEFVVNFTLVKMKA